MKKVLPVIIEAITADATITVKVSYLKTSKYNIFLGYTYIKIKQTRVIQISVANADCHASVGIFSIRSKKMPSS
jgi:type VI protein secretion system component Hcp